MVRLRATLGTPVLSGTPRGYLVADDYVYRSVGARSRRVSSDNDPAPPRARYDAQSHAHPALGKARTLNDGHFCNAGRDGGKRAAASRSARGYALLQSRRRWRCSSLPAPLLVLWTSGGLHHLLAGGRNSFHSRAVFHTPPHFRTHRHCRIGGGDRIHWLRSLGASHVRHRPAAIERKLFYGSQPHDRHTHGSPIFLLVGDHVAW